MPWLLTPFWNGVPIMGRTQARVRSIVLRTMAQVIFTVQALPMPPVLLPQSAATNRFSAATRTLTWLSSTHWARGYGPLITEVPVLILVIRPPATIMVMFSLVEIQAAAAV